MSGIIYNPVLNRTGSLPGITQGVAASRPAAGLANGDWYLATDTKILYRWDKLSGLWVEELNDGGGGGVGTIQQVLNTGNQVGPVGPTLDQRFTDLAGHTNDITNLGMDIQTTGTHAPNSNYYGDQWRLIDNQVNFFLATSLGWTMQDFSGNTNNASATDIKLNGISVALKPQVNVQTGTTYAFDLPDDGNYITANNAANQLYTIPTNASKPFRIGATIQVIVIGAGKVTIAVAGGVTVNSKSGNLSNNGQFVGISIVKIATNTWNLMGDLTA